MEVEVDLRVFRGETEDEGPSVVVVWSLVDFRLASTTRIKTSAVSLSSLEMRNAPALRIVRRVLDESVPLLFDDASGGFASPAPALATAGSLDFDFRAKWGADDDDKFFERGFGRSSGSSLMAASEELRFACERLDAAAAAAAACVNDVFGNDDDAGVMSEMLPS